MYSPMPEQFSPLRLFIALVTIIFVTEAAVMALLPILISHDIHPLAEAMIDATILTIVSSVFLWRFFVRPLRFALMSKTAQAAAIMDTAAEGIVTIDEHGVIESFNRAAHGMFGYAVTEAVGANVSMLMPQPHAREHDTHIANYLRTGQARVIGKPRVVSALRKDGTVFPIELNVTELKLGGNRSFTGVIRDITERKLAEEHIRHLAHHDALTGLPNRTLFYDRLRQAMALAGRERHELALLYIDLDRFKAVNDSLGHDAGDELLKAVAARMRSLVRGADTVARMGGDEFTVIVPKLTSREGAATLAQKLIDALSAPFQLHLAAPGPAREVRIGSSIGIAVYPADTQDIDGLIKAADSAMYEAKRARNAFCFYQPQAWLRG
jgi:diguanylate cyclase (GGDEF)-like protein/PAS domain S-box-containing protein